MCGRDRGFKETGKAMNFEAHLSGEATILMDGSALRGAERGFAAEPGLAGVPVVLSGGGGSRLWPFSTADAPKQFLPLINNKSLFSEALDRVRGRENFRAPIIVGSILHADLCAAEVKEDGDDARLILEP